MNLRKLNREQYLAFSAITLLSLILSVIFFKQLGAKDAAMFFIGTILLLLEIYLLRVNKKLSVLLFIISFPIIVTARKICYFDFLVFRITFETIYITILFLSSFKDIIQLLKSYLHTKDSLEFKFIILLLAFIIFAYNSSIYSFRLNTSITEIFISVITPVIFMLSVISIFRKEDMKNLWLALIIGIDLSCLYGFLQIVLYHIPFKEIKSNREFLTFGYHNINIFASILMMIMPFLLEILLYKNKTIKEKLFITFSLAVSLFALFLTYTRGAWISFLIALFLVLISKKYKRVIYVLLFLFICVAKPVISFILKRGTSTSIFADESAIARVQSIFTSIKMIITYPFGTGSATFAEMYKKYMESGYLLIPQSIRAKIHVANYALENAHNLWLQIGVELGLVCLIIFILIFVNRVKLAIKNYRNNRPNIISLVMFLIFSILTGFEFNHKGVITNNLILWLVFAMIQINSEDEIKEENL